MHSIPVEGSGQHMMGDEAYGKIPAFAGQDADNNKKILKILADKGPQSKYGITKEIIEKERARTHFPLENVGLRTRQFYPTVSRRVDDLAERGYLKSVEERAASKGPMKSKFYGLTWKGLASVILLDPSKNVIDILRENSLLDQDFETHLKVFEEIYTVEEIKEISTKFVMKFLEQLPFDVETVKDEELALYVIPTFLLIADKIDKDVLVKSREELSKIPRIEEILLRWTDGYVQTTEKHLEDSKRLRDFIRGEIKEKRS